jgi:ABC-type dipeptide/oligopeptide/nickel transport system permease component
MGRYILGRIGGMILVLIAVSAITFYLMHKVPGSPFDMMQLQANKQLPDEIRDILLVKYGLDQPWYTQYFIFVKNTFFSWPPFDFGYSFWYNGQTIIQILQRQWPYSLQLGLLTASFSIIVGMGLGIAGGIKPGTWIDWLGTGVSLFCLATPSFVLALFLQIIFSVKLGWLPTGGIESAKNWILPTLANSLGPVLILQRYTKASMLDVVHSNYVRTARAKGLKQARITFIHIFKNALTPVVTVLGPMLAGLITGSFFIEQIFRIPGVGQFFYAAIQNRDYPLIMATTLAWTLIISATYLITDLVYAMIDPRVTYVKEK